MDEIIKLSDSLKESTSLDVLIDYFRPFWDYGRDFMTLNPSAPQPHFHGMIISTNQEHLEQSKKNLVTAFGKSGIGFNKSYIGKADSIHNRAGEFTFLNIKEDEFNSQYDLLRGRDCDIVIVTPEIIITEEMEKQLVAFCKGAEPSRLVVLGHSEDNKAISLLEETIDKR